MSNPDYCRDITQLACILRSRIASLQAEIDDLMAEVLPQKATEKVLSVMGEKVAKYRETADVPVQHVSDLDDFVTAREHFFSVSIQVAHCVSLLGFLRRSAHERNPYEFYGPLAALAHDFLGAKHDLVLSSEWDYSPFTRHADLSIDGLSCIFVGLPVTEAGNPLIIPLAGHELGHSLWNQWRAVYEMLEEARRYIAGKKGDKVKSLADQKRLSAMRENERRLSGGQYELIRQKVEECLNKHIAADRKQTSHKSAAKKISPEAPAERAKISTVLNQVEEVFCDVVGTRMFGASYLYAYHYLVSPGVAGSCDVNYPANEHRYRLMKEALRRMQGDSGLSLPEGAHWWCEVQAEGGQESQDRHYGALVLDDVLGLLIETVDGWFRNHPLALPTAAECCGAKAKLDIGSPIPAPIGETLPKVILAGWMAHLATEGADVDGERRRIINEMVLKSIELLEISFLRVESEVGVSVAD